MRGKVFIEELRLQCHIGVTSQEREKRQEVIVSVYMDIDPKRASETDSLSETMNYSELHSHILQLAETMQFELLETLAGKIADLCLRDDHVVKATIEVKKPHLYDDVKSVGVILEKEK